MRRGGAAGAANGESLVLTELRATIMASIGDVEDVIAVSISAGFCGEPVERVRFACLMSNFDGSRMSAVTM